MSEAVEKLKKIEEDALALARNARSLLLNEGLEEGERRDTKTALVYHLLETRGPMRLRDLVKLTGRQMKAVYQSIELLLGRGKIQRVSRGVYAVAGRKPGQLTQKPKKRVRVRKPRQKSTLEQLGEL
jgi:hypothetical protein